MELFKRTFFLETSIKVLLAYQLCRHCANSSKIMRSVAQKKFGGANELYINTTPVPQPDPNQVLIRVHATALNRADLLLREGRYPGMKNPVTLGLEGAGTVEAVGGNSSKWKVGEKVMALLNGGGYAEYAVVNEEHVMPIPKHMDFTEAAAIPEVWLTAYQLLHFLGKVQKDEIVLIHGGGSGVGTAAIQLANLSGAKTIVTAGTHEKISFAKTLGAFAGFNYKEGEFVDKVMNATNGKGANVILDCVGGSYWKQNAECLATDGRWVLYGLLGGVNVDGPLFSHILRKRASIIGTTLKSRSDAYKAELVQSFASNALPYFDNKTIKPIVDTIFPLESVVDAHEYMASNKNNGKIILTVKEGHKNDEL